MPAFGRPHPGRLRRQPAGTPAHPVEMPAEGRPYPGRLRRQPARTPAHPVEVPAFGRPVSWPPSAASRRGRRRTQRTTLPGARVSTPSHRSQRRPDGCRREARPTDHRSLGAPASSPAAATGGQNQRAGRRPAPLTTRSDVLTAAEEKHTPPTIARWVRRRPRRLAAAGGQDQRAGRKAGSAHRSQRRPDGCRRKARPTDHRSLGAPASSPAAAAGGQNQRAGRRPAPLTAPSDVVTAAEEKHAPPTIARWVRRRPRRLPPQAAKTNAPAERPAPLTAPQRRPDGCRREARPTDHRSLGAPASPPAAATGGQNQRAGRKAGSTTSAPPPPPPPPKPKPRRYA